MPVFINNVDDYLGPNQACVNPLFAAPPKATPSHPGDAHPLADDGRDKISITVNDGRSRTTTENNAGAPFKAAVPNRRRTRRRRAPPVIVRCEEGGDSPPSRVSGGPLRLTNEEGKYDDGGVGAPATAAAVTTQMIKKKVKATVTLSDCLSCSGCVTSAEAVLMSHHSVDKLREAAQSQNKDLLPRKTVAFTISSASLADLYRHLYLEAREKSIADDADRNDEHTVSATTSEKSLPSRHEFLAKIAAFLHAEFGAEMLIDGSLPQRISLMESAYEFCYRYRKTQQSRDEDNNNGGNVALASNGICDKVFAAMPSVALSSTRTRYINQNPGSQSATDEDTLEVTTLSHPPGRLNEEDRGESNVPPSIQSTSLPMLASSCPGFVCLVEKTAPVVVPLLSSAKSPMAVAGTLLKTGECNNANRNSHPETSENMQCDTSSFYHVAIMPCHDKKLEAGRGDFAWERQALLQYGNSFTPLSTNDAQSPTTVVSVEEVKSEHLVNEVDLVLTTGELLEVLSDAVSKRKGVGVSSLSTQLPKSSENRNSITSSIRNLLASDGLFHGSCSLITAESVNWPRENRRMEHKNNLELDTGVHGSGSYADYIFRYAAKDIFGCNLPRDESLPWKSSTSNYGAAPTAGNSTGVIRRRRRRHETTDLREIMLYEHSDGTHSCYDKTSGDSSHSSRPVLRFATAYGFKNVQLILQGLSKTGLSKSSKEYDYVEIMACPSGCSNGGGQIGAQGQRETPREAKERVKKTVSAVPIVCPPAERGSLATALCGCDTQCLVDESILCSECFGERSRALFHTHFHIVPKLELSTGATAGVAVSDTRW